MKGFFDGLGIEVGVWSMALWGIPTAIAAFVAMAWRARALDQRLSLRYPARKPGGDA